MLARLSPREVAWWVSAGGGVRRALDGVAEFLMDDLHAYSNIFDEERDRG